MDCITKLQPESPGGGSTIIVAVDPFSKWVEAGPLRDLRAGTVTEWVHEQIVCRYGTPAWVRCDQGTEFAGDFAHYCATVGIWVRRIASHNPRANG